MVTYYLQKTLTQAGNTHGFAGVNIQFSFDTALTKVVEKIDKKIPATAMRGRSKPSYGSYPSLTLLVDIKNIGWSFVISGVLTNDDGNMTAAKYNVDVTQTGSAVVDTAVNKKNLLIAMSEQGGSLKWFHRNFGSTRPAPPSEFEQATTYEPVNILSMEFEDVETEVGADETTIMKPNEQRLRFTIVLQRGQDRQ